MVARRAAPSSPAWSPASPCATSFIELGLEQLGGDEEQASPLKRVVHTVAVGDFQGQSAHLLSNCDSSDVATRALPSDGQDVLRRSEHGGELEM